MAARAHNKEQGSIILGAILLVVVLAIVLLGIIKWQAWQAKREQGIALGNQIAEVINAIEMRASFDAKFNDGTYGINALQENRCGGLSTKAYLPCGFKWDGALLGGTPYFVISHDQSDPAIVKAQFIAGPIGLHHKGRFLYMPYLAATALNTARAKVINTTGKFLSASAVYSLDRKQSAVTANIVANQNNANIYLRVDGSNQMRGKLRFDSDIDAQKRSIENVSHITSSDLDVESDALQINTTGHPVLLGNQTGVKGQSNVTVNDLTIHSMGDQKLTSLLGSSKISSDFKNDGRSSLNVIGTSGGTGRLFVNGYCSAWQQWDKAVVQLKLFFNGREVTVASGWVMEFDGTSHHSSAQPELTWMFLGLPKNTRISGIKITCTGENGGVHDIGYWTMGL